MSGGRFLIGVGEVEISERILAVTAKRIYELLRGSYDVSNLLDDKLKLISSDIEY